MKKVCAYRRTFAEMYIESAPATYVTIGTHTHEHENENKNENNKNENNKRFLSMMIHHRGMLYLPILLLAYLAVGSCAKQTDDGNKNAPSQAGDTVASASLASTGEMGQARLEAFASTYQNAAKIFQQSSEKLHFCSQFTGVEGCTAQVNKWFAANNNVANSAKLCALEEAPSRTQTGYWFDRELQSYLRISRGYDLPQVFIWMIEKELAQKVGNLLVGWPKAPADKSSNFFIQKLQSFSAGLTYLTAQYLKWLDENDYDYTKHGLEIFYQTSDVTSQAEHLQKQAQICTSFLESIATDLTRLCPTLPTTSLPLCPQDPVMCTAQIRYCRDGEEPTGPCPCTKRS